jgi:hypothetical protein
MWKSALHAHDNGFCHFVGDDLADALFAPTADVRRRFQILCFFSHI